MKYSSEITQRIRFNCDYLIHKPGGGYSIQPCLYTVDATVVSTHPSEAGGRILEFAHLKQYMQEVVPDNKFIVDQSVPQPFVKVLTDIGVSVQFVNFEICAENLCAWIADMLKGRLYLNEVSVDVTEVVLNENGTSTARWRNN